MKQLKKAPSLREQLERLASTAPTVHAAEDAIGGEEDVAAPAARWAGDDAPGGPAPRRPGLLARVQFEADMATAGPRYAGKVVPAAHALGALRRARPADSDGEEEEKDDEEEEEEEEKEEEKDDERDQEDEEEEDGGEGGSGGDEDYGEDGVEGDGMGGGAAAAAAGRDWGAAGGGGASMDAELQSLLAADAAALSRYRAADSEDRDRGADVAAQVRAVDALVEARIQLQRAVTGANRFPRGALHGGACAASDELAEAFSGLREGAAALLGDLLELRAELARGEFAGLPPPPPRAPPPCARALWGAAEGGWAALAPWRDATLDKWARKLALGGDGALKRGVKLKVLGAHSLSAQVAEALAVGGARAAALTCARRDAVGAPLCHPREPGGAPGELDDETFDDSDLYAALLKDFLAREGAAAGGGGAGGRKRVNVKREGVDRKATKGRKLKYIVHPKLVNFAAPSPFIVPPDLAMDIDTLVSSLFQ